MTLLFPLVCSAYVLTAARHLRLCCDDNAGKANPKANVWKACENTGRQTVFPHAFHTHTHTPAYPAGFSHFCCHRSRIAVAVCTSICSNRFKM